MTRRPTQDDAFTIATDTRKKETRFRTAASLWAPALAIVPGVVLLGQEGVLRSAEFFEGILARDPLKLTATGLTFAGGGARHHRGAAGEGSQQSGSRLRRDQEPPRQHGYPKRRGSAQGFEKR